MWGIQEAKADKAENFTIKQMEKTRKGLQMKLDKLNDQSRKDDVVTFEELGVDRIFIDESHFYKNLFLYTKMRNVGGIAQTEAQKSSDLFMKCRYLDEITGGPALCLPPVPPSATPWWSYGRIAGVGPIQKIGRENRISKSAFFISKAGKIVRSQLAGIQRKMYKIVPAERQKRSNETITKNRCKPSKNGLQRSFLAPPAGFEPVACRLGVRYTGF